MWLLSIIIFLVVEILFLWQFLQTDQFVFYSSNNKKINKSCFFLLTRCIDLWYFPSSFYFAIIFCTYFKGFCKVPVIIEKMYRGLLLRWTWVWTVSNVYTRCPDIWKYDKHESENTFLSIWRMLKVIIVF